jgi:uncharacterized protein
MSTPIDADLTDAQRRMLVALARASATARVLQRELPAAPAEVFPPASGTFVTIRCGGELRGCLGTLSCTRGLAREVARCAADAAAEDPRFPAIRPDELDVLSFEVSVLGPLEPIDPHDPAAVAIGRHGLVVESGARRGLLLPQVAVEWNWSRDEFLDRTCVKAGLAAGAWRQGATVLRFTADVFGE